MGVNPSSIYQETWVTSSTPIPVRMSHPFEFKMGHYRDYIRSTDALETDWVQVRTILAIPNALCHPCPFFGQSGDNFPYEESPQSCYGADRAKQGTSMRDVITESGTPLPFLFRYAVDRTGTPDIDGRYSDIDCVWVVDTAQGPIPIIDRPSALGELITKTAAHQEEDDERWSQMLELTTKTDAKPETDDQADFGPSLLELSTKTHAQAESDDISPSSPTFF